MKKINIKIYFKNSLGIDRRGGGQINGARHSYNNNNNDRGMSQ